jgi:hypothetical protein
MAFQGKERNKLIVGILLLAAGAYLAYNAIFASPQPAAPAVKSQPPAARTNAPERPAMPSARRAGKGAAAKAPTGPIDPKLRLDLLEKSASVAYEPGAGRNIFAFGVPPPPPAVKLPPRPPAPAPFPMQNPNNSGGSMATQIAIPLKFFGTVNKPNDPVKTALLQQDDETFIAREGDIVNKRYRILKIGVNTIEVEDIVTKSRQVLPYVGY